MRGSSSRKPLTWTRSLPGRMRILAATHRQDWTFAWVSDLDAAKQEGPQAGGAGGKLGARAKKELAPALPYAYQQLAYVHMYSGEVREAVARTAAVKLDPQYADGHAALAQMLIYDGQPQAALAAMEEAKKWNPKPPAYYHYHVGQAYYVLGVLEKQTSHFETATGHLQKALEISANFSAGPGLSGRCLHLSSASSGGTK